MKTFKYGELCVDIDTSDYLVLKKYRTESEKYEAVMKDCPTKDYIETLKYVIKAETDLLDAVIFDGASNQMFGECITSLDQVMDGFEALGAFFNRQQKARAERYGTYSPKNRTARRVKK